ALCHRNGIDDAATATQPGAELLQARWTAMPCGLFVCVRERDEAGFVPGAAEERDSRRQRVVARVAHGHVDGREAGRRREELAVVAMGRVQVPDQPWRVAPGWIHERIELLCVHRLQQSRANLLAIVGLGRA